MTRSTAQGDDGAGTVGVGGVVSLGLLTSLGSGCSEGRVAYQHGVIVASTVEPRRDPGHWQVQKGTVATRLGGS